MASIHNEEIRRFLVEHVPEIANGPVSIKGIARKPGERALIVVDSTDPRTGPVGAVVGPKGERIKAMVKQLNGEKIDVVRWSESPQDLIRNGLAPLQVEHVALDPTTKSAKAFVRAENLSAVRISPDLICQLLSEILGLAVKIVEL